jgi:superfamily II DNA or RNA helicase
MSVGTKLHSMARMDAVRAMFDQEQGLVIGQPGMGKSQIILYFCANVKTRSLVLVHTKDILDQWEEYAKLSIPGFDLGVIQGRRQSVGHITIATVQTFKNLIVEDPDKWGKMFGAVILDEAHHAAATTFEQILNLSAMLDTVSASQQAPTRADKKHPYVQLVLGPIIYRKKFESQGANYSKGGEDRFLCPL